MNTKVIISSTYWVILEINMLQVELSPIEKKVKQKHLNIVTKYYKCLLGKLIDVLFWKCTLDSFKTC